MRCPFDETDKKRNFQLGKMDSLLPAVSLLQEQLSNSYHLLSYPASFCST